MNVTIRPYQPDDRRTIVRLYDDFQDFLVAMDPIKRLRRLPGYGMIAFQKSLRDIEKKNGVMCVAMKENRIIGFVVGVIIKQKAIERYECIPTITGRVTELFVQESQRGKNVGSLLMQNIEHYFKANDCNVIRIEVFEPNAGAHSFYQSHGYTDRLRDIIKQI